jgi:hypothetical protein
MGNEHMHLHDAYEVELKGNKILIDCGIVDLVWWMNQIPGVDTFTSCQGGSECCRPDAFVGFTSANPRQPERILETLGFGRLSEDNDAYELSFEVSELIALNQKHFAESPNWNNAFNHPASETPEQEPTSGGNSASDQIPEAETA